MSDDHRRCSPTHTLAEDAGYPDVRGVEAAHAGVVLVEQIVGARPVEVAGRAGLLRVQDSTPATLTGVQRRPGDIARFVVKMARGSGNTGERGSDASMPTLQCLVCLLPISQHAVGRSPRQPIVLFCGGGPTLDPRAKVMIRSQPIEHLVGQAPGEDPAQPRPLVTDLRGRGGWGAVVLGLTFAQIAVHWDSRGVGNYTAVFQFHRRDAEDAEFLTVLAENNHFSAPLR